MSERLNSSEIQLSEEQLKLIDGAHRVIELNSGLSQTYPTDLNFRKPISMIGYLANKLAAKLKGDELADNDENILERYETLITTTKVLLKKQKPEETKWDSYGGAPLYLEQRIINEIYNNVKQETLRIYTEVIANTGMGGMGDVGLVKRGLVNLLAPLDAETVKELQLNIDEALNKST